MTIWESTKKSAADVVKTLQSSTQGLSSHAAAQALDVYGKNDGVKQQTPLWAKILKRQLKSPFIYLLAVAAVVSLCLGQHIDGSFIVFFVLLNTGLGFYQEYRSEQTARLLSQLVCTKANVLRDGHEQAVDVLDVVPGDILTLKPGDVLPADARLILVDGLQIDESVLSGESAPVSKTERVAEKQINRVFEAENVVFAGTSLTAGSGLAVVVVTGMGSMAHKMGNLVASTEHTSTFEKNIAAFSRFIIELILITLGVVLVAHFVFKSGSIEPSQLFVFAVALAVSVVPEALPVVTTFSLSQGARRLSRKHVIVKRLSAIEDLGGIEVLCTDKTGTLTENDLRVADLHQVNSIDPMAAAASIIVIDKKGIVTNPFDRALLAAVKVKHVNPRVLASMPFDPGRRFETLVIEGKDGFHSILRGAPEALLSRAQSLPTAKAKALQSWIHEAGKRGQRVLAVAGRRLPAQVAASAPATLLKQAEEDIHFYGCIAFADPIKASTMAAVHQAKHLGVQVKMLTGDRAEVAGAVAHQVGLIASAEDVMTGDAFFAASEAEQQRLADAFQVFARVSPEQKLQIIAVLQKKYSVGFLGEGINDAPALKRADVAIVVNDASNVARNAADIILLRKSLHVVIDGIAEGRMVFANTLKYIRATLSSNVGNFYAIALASLFIDVLPLLPIQILLVNLLTDFPMILIATDHVDMKDLAKPHGYQVRDIASVALILGLVSALFDFITFGAFLYAGDGVLQTNWFVVSVLTELVFLFSVRTPGLFFKSRPSNTLLALTGLAFVVAIALPYSLVGSDVFHFIAPQKHQLFLIFGIVIGYFVTTETVKLLFIRHAKSTANKAN